MLIQSPKCFEVKITPLNDRSITDRDAKIIQNKIILLATILHLQNLSSWYSRFMKTSEIQKIIRATGMRATQARIDVLSVLIQHHNPLSADDLHEDAPNMDRVTMYRILDAFVENGIALPVELGERARLYEYNRGDDHHHLVCKECRKIEDVHICEINALQEKITRQSKQFNTILNHKLEFEGLCKDCES